MEIDENGSESSFPTGSVIEVEIETPCLSFVKRRSDGHIDFISPVPSPFDYGFVPGTIAGDGDPQDAIVFTRRRLRRFDRLSARVVGRVRVIDAGACDDKLVTIEEDEFQERKSDLSASARIRLIIFFSFYGIFKKILNRFRLKSGETKVISVDV